MTVRFFLSHQARAWALKSSQSATTSGQEIVLDVVKGALDAPRAVGVARGVSSKDRAVACGESFHLRRWDHVLPRASQDDDVGVVDHHLLGRTLEVAQGLGEEELAFKASESRVALEEDHA